MFLPIFAYEVISIICAVTAGLHVGLKPAVCTLGASVISVIAAGGIKAGLLWGKGPQRIGTLAVGVLLVALAYWLGSGFSVVLWSNVLSGQEWAGIGTVVGLVFVTKKLAT